MTESTRPAPGTRLVFRWRKWDGSPHWEHDCLYLGADEWGDWFGQSAGSRSARPGREVDVVAPNVTLMPASGEWAFTRNIRHRTRTYIDLAWDLHWEPDGTPLGIDMDLDVVDRRGEGVYIEDRDEWDEHRVQLGYPLGIVGRLEDVALDLERRVAASEPPFDDAVPQRWLDELARLEAL